MRPSLETVLSEIRACRVCAADLPHVPRPVIRASRSARLCIVGQAPGTRVHATGIPFNDRSGDVLRAWLGVTPDVFYDERRIAIVPMGFCFPGQDDKGGDRPPRRECAPLWRTRVFAELPNLQLTVLVGLYAQRWHLGARRHRTLRETVARWRDYGPDYFPLPHPSWRNRAWLSANPWFAEDVVPALRARVSAILAKGEVY